jgi:hypothetical protein
MVRGEKKIKKLIKLRKLEKNKKKSNREKKLIRIFKKLTGSVRFYKLKTKKTNQTLIGKKPSRTKKNQTEPN